MNFENEGAIYNDTKRVSRFLWFNHKSLLNVNVENYKIVEIKRHFSLSFSDQKVVPCSSTRGKRFATVVMATVGKKEKMEKPPEKTI